MAIDPAHSQENPSIAIVEIAPIAIKDNVRTRDPLTMYAYCAVWTDSVGEIN